MKLKNKIGRKNNESTSLITIKPYLLSDIEAKKGCHILWGMSLLLPSSMNAAQKHANITIKTNICPKLRKNTKSTNISTILGGIS